ncbi:hypothetical protein [Streptomyces sp. GS7]|uniref:hypothetical protein n=1 Tax=Streptomyces sp. GS7 TaxID=2692234 RepID=UPI0013187E4F|nr:hypothetical protein [Streptomyces sp. GS7]QHC24459.1 hypothetical protein GR130_26895 [Streptomyces sp. GS7]
MEPATAPQYADAPRQAAEEAAAPERAGPGAVRAAEAYGFGAPTAMRFPADRTEHAGIGPAIVNVHPIGPGPAKPIETVRNRL